MAAYTALEIALLLAVTLVYALFDVFNKRNIPDKVVYTTLVIGIVVAVLFNYSVILLDFAIAAIVALLGFIVYRSGYLGGGDVLELVFIALVLPIQVSSYLNGMPQLNIPFIVSVIIGAGYTAALFIPIYYILYKRILAGKRLSRPRGRNMLLGAVLLVTYAMFAFAFSYLSDMGIIAAVIIMSLAVASCVSIVFEHDIYREMTNMIYPKALEEGDMIAVNIMSQEDLGYFRKAYPAFGRLATAYSISKMKGIKRKLPVYRNSVPFSLFIFLGVVISLSLGNLVLTLLNI